MSKLKVFADDKIDMMEFFLREGYSGIFYRKGSKHWGKEGENASTCIFSYLVSALKMPLSQKEKVFENTVKKNGKMLVASIFSYCYR